LLLLLPICWFGGTLALNVGLWSQGSYDQPSYHPFKAINSSAVVVNGIVYVGADEGKLYVLDAVSGSKKWSYQTGES
jgi:eukaryotic-like serine/threonine-protein kinase